MNWKLAGLGAGSAGLGFIAWRFSEESKMEALIETLHLNWFKPKANQLLQFWSFKTADAAFAEYRHSPQYVEALAKEAVPLVDLSLKNIFGLRK